LNGFIVDFYEPAGAGGEVEGGLLVVPVPAEPGAFAVGASDDEALVRDEEDLGSCGGEGGFPYAVAFEVEEVMEADDYHGSGPLAVTSIDNPLFTKDLNLFQAFMSPAKMQ
jgi:hypothetical protein